MVNINFVPDDYINNRQLRRTNLMYVVLVVVLIGGLIGTLGSIKIRQRWLNKKASAVHSKKMAAKEAISHLEQLQSQRNDMMKTALLTAELIEPAPRSILLAMLTNELPGGVSLLKIKLAEKTISVRQVAPVSKYDAAKNANATPVAREVTQTRLEIEGLAISDIGVAGYIANLNNSILLDNVGLEYSKEHKVDKEVFRQFKLTAMLKADIKLSKKDINSIKTKRQRSL